MEGMLERVTNYRFFPNQFLLLLNHMVEYSEKTGRQGRLPPRTVRL